MRSLAVMSSSSVCDGGAASLFFRGIAGLSHFTVISSVLVVSFPKMSITLTTTVYFPGCRVRVLRLKLYLGFFACPVGLPLIVKSVVLVVPIRSPIVDKLTPVFDGLPRFFWDVICGDDKVREFESQFSRLLLSAQQTKRPSSKKRTSPCSTAFLSKTSRGIFLKDTSTRDSAATCFASSFTSRANSQPRMSTPSFRR